MLTKIKKYLKTHWKEWRQSAEHSRATLGSAQSTSPMRDVSPSPSRAGISSVTAALLPQQWGHPRQHRGRVWSSCRSCWYVSGDPPDWSQKTGELFRTAGWPDPSQTCHSCQPLPFASRSQWWNGQGWSPGASWQPCNPSWSCLSGLEPSWSVPCLLSSRMCLWRCSMGMSPTGLTQPPFIRKKKYRVITGHRDILVSVLDTRFIWIFKELEY